MLPRTITDFVCLRWVKGSDCAPRVPESVILLCQKCQANLVGPAAMMEQTWFEKCTTLRLLCHGMHLNPS